MQFIVGMETESSLVDVPLVLFPDMGSISKAFFPVTNTLESLKTAIFELRTEFADGVLGECYFRAITEFGDQPKSQAK